ncbi:hypothetical protein JJV70_18605 [Streptomyces sp. JJ66]|uniref:hypothetical protein n=1 Tax=Streptomyces sp. JJ66 TaxID=2803843 RepID=UPI001C5A1AAC|nr:hypothetical protein [Streptomyces sp. JJ66]MBW1604080.1 hypothetical protein [Streptomyces sp. JJ66]
MSEQEEPLTPDLPPQTEAPDLAEAQRLAEEKERREAEDYDSEGESTEPTD